MPFRILNFGSLNVDYVYRVKAFVLPGETLAVESRQVVCGGKGLNQSVAMARSGAAVRHAGTVGQGAEGDLLIAALEAAGVDASLVRRCEDACGHAVIQVSDAGENSILLYGGANRRATDAQIAAALDTLGAGDLLALQNEVNGVAVLMREAARRGVRVAINPSPTFGAERLPLSLADYFFVNEEEARTLSGAASGDDPLDAMARAFPKATVVLTRGSRGADVALPDGGRVHQPAIRVAAVDTTGAGDTFMGYFLGGLSQGMAVPACADLAARAAALCVTRVGASPAIPTRAEVDAFRP